jgi:hypothetical protein
MISSTCHDSPTRVSYCGAANFLTKPRWVTAKLVGGDVNTAHLVNNAGIIGDTAV